MVGGPTTCHHQIQPWPLGRHQRHTARRIDRPARTENGVVLLPAQVHEMRASDGNRTRVLSLGSAVKRPATDSGDPYRLVRGRRRPSVVQCERPRPRDLRAMRDDLAVRRRLDRPFPVAARRRAGSARPSYGSLTASGSVTGPGHQASLPRTRSRAGRHWPWPAALRKVAAQTADRTYRWASGRPSPTSSSWPLVHVS